MKEQDMYKSSVTDRPEDYGGPRAWRHEEIAGGISDPVWVEKDFTKGEFVTYPKRCQGPQSSCVAYSYGKLLAIDELSENGVWRELSPRSLYSFTHVPGGGSSALDSVKLLTKIGMTLEHLFPTEGLSEEQVVSSQGYALDARQVALVYKPGSYVECNADFETIASIIEGFRKQGIKKGVGISMIGTSNGSTFSLYPIPPKYNDRVWYHRITVTDYGLINGKKVLAFDNSFGIQAGHNGQQFLTKEYEPFIYGGIYTLNQADGSNEAKPEMFSYDWQRDLAYGSIGQDVLALQKALQLLGMFPITKVLAPTGNYFGLTQKCVEIFQQAYFIPVTGKLDEATRARLNEIF